MQQPYDDIIVYRAVFVNKVSASAVMFLADWCINTHGIEELFSFRESAELTPAVESGAYLKHELIC
jgi:hypothetical protein